MIILEPRNMHWIRDIVDDDKDVCAHGNIYFEVNGTTLVDGSSEDFTVSGAALYLLRSLEADYIAEKEVNNQIFPCCAHGMFAFDNEEDVLIIGCSLGTDFDVLHRLGRIVIVFNGKRYRVSEKEWRKAVLHFSDMVKAYYNSCSPKDISEWDEENTHAYEVFLAEWDRRVKAARALDQR
ncbi:MAG: hypothetical protein H0S79_24365 [Anaerolineaceae bacterium]|nr:hypothetical protein [Anaerolineaceae bacterium]